MSLIRSLILILLVSVSGLTMAETTISTGKIVRLGAQECCGSAAPYAYFSVKNRVLSSNDCSNTDNFFAVPLNTALGKAQYSLLLAARMSGNSITVYGNGTCVQTRPVFEDVHSIEVVPDVS